MRQCKHCTAAQKVAILREHLENRLSISETAERYGIHPSLVLRWKKQLFEQGAEIFERSGRKAKLAARKEQQLRDRLKAAQEVITELATENLELRKNFSGEI